MPTVEKTSGGRVYIRSLDQRFAVGDRVDVDEEMAAYLCDERGDFSRIVEKEGADDADSDSGKPDETVYPADEPPFDPGEHTVDEIEERLEENDYDEPELLALYSAEAESEERQTALGAIEQSQDDLED